jgi:hypothetical protein
MEQGSTIIRDFVKHLEIKEEFGDKNNNLLNAILSNGLKEPHGTNIRRWTPKLTVSLIFKREGAVLYDPIL